ncbi:MAG: hypothetical protein NC484_08170 [Alloprevotella sp.]|nr:hypothetical protein [Alloprevotella sp.]
MNINKASAKILNIPQSANAAATDRVIGRRYPAATDGRRPSAAIRPRQRSHLRADAAATRRAPLRLMAGGHPLRHNRGLRSHRLGGQLRYPRPAPPREYTTPAGLHPADDARPPPKGY